MSTVISHTDLPAFARGAAILGTGGGGDPYIGQLLAEEAIRRHGPIPLVDPTELDDDACVVPVAMMGAPTVMVEKIPAVGQAARTVRSLAAHLDRSPTHIACIEAGGVNAMLPFVAAAELGLPVVDGDAMGRAFPELQMVLPTLAGVSASPVAVVDDKNNHASFVAVDNQWAERLARATIVEMGCSAIVALYAMTGAEVRDTFVTHTLSLCRALGNGISDARWRHADPVEATCRRLTGTVLHTGKVTDVNRTTSRGFSRGQVIVEGLDHDRGHRLIVEFQNENLVARTDQTILATTPDLIIIVDTDTGEPITTEGLQYGHRASVLTAPCDPRWHTPLGIELVGPRYFGYDLDPVSHDPRSASTSPATEPATP